MYIKQTANTLRTFGECSLTTHEIGCETLPNSPRPQQNWLRNTPPIPHVHHEIGCETPRQFPTSTTKWGANTPSGVGADSSCPYPNIIKSVHSHYQICAFVSLNSYSSHSQIRTFTLCTHVFTLSNTHIRSPFRVSLRICGRDKSAPTAADGLPIMWRTFCKHSTYTHEMGCEHSARCRGRFIAPVS